jgi:hypothetical protein
MPRPPQTPAYDRALARRQVEPCSTTDGDCWIYNGASKGQPHAEEPDNDHRKIRAFIDGRWRLDYVHRVSYRHHHGEIPEGMVVRHKCDRRACFAPHHLELGSLKENWRDAVSRGRARPFVCQPNPQPVEETDDCPF